VAVAAVAKAVVAVTAAVAFDGVAVNSCVYYGEKELSIAAVSTAGEKKSLACAIPDESKVTPSGGVVDEDDNRCCCNQRLMRSAAVDILNDEARLAGKGGRIHLGKTRNHLRFGHRGAFVGMY